MWAVNFSGVAVEGNVPLLTVDASSLTGTGVSAGVVETVAGNEPNGRFKLQADTALRGWPEHRSGWINVGASPAEVEAAVVEIPGIRAALVRVNSSLPTVGPIVWEVTFTHRQLVSSDDHNGLGFVATDQSGDRPTLRVVRCVILTAGLVGALFPGCLFFLGIYYV